MQNKGEANRKEDFVQWVNLGLKKAMTPSNIKASFLAIGIWPLNPQELNNKMKPSEGFIEKPLEVQVQEILEEDTFCSQNDAIHYCVDLEGKEPHEE